MDDVVDSPHCHVEAIEIPYIADEVTHIRLIPPQLHF
jgi:hypothetical protein